MNPFLHKQISQCLNFIVQCRKAKFEGTNGYYELL